MLNYIWAFMILIGIVYAIITGNIEAVSNGFLDSSKEAITLCITMLGIISFWTGIMEVGKQAGIIRQLTKVITPLVNFLFPNIPKDHKSREYITTNMIANILGLGWAATPPGLKAMEHLAELNREQNGEAKAHIASDEMCTFLVINISSLQLIPVNIIAYRSQYGSVNPTAIVAPAIIATLINTIVGVIYCKWKSRKGAKQFR
ncbi:MAG: nucleoside recognition protein [Lachnospiraceae bacterium]|nr:nucleoside recognition protein [Lachnospiraceae bacterium]